MHRVMISLIGYYYLSNCGLSSRKPLAYAAITVTFVTEMKPHQVCDIE
jgi:hypothetical protein